MADKSHMSDLVMGVEDMSSVIGQGWYFVLFCSVFFIIIIKIILILIIRVIKSKF
jgi:hypothetical protein